MASIWEFLKGKKTYVIAGSAIIVALFGHFFGPIMVDGNVTVPQYSWFNVYTIALNSGFFASIRHGIESNKS